MLRPQHNCCVRPRNSTKYRRFCKVFPWYQVTFFQLCQKHSFSYCRTQKVDTLVSTFWASVHIGCFSHYTSSTISFRVKLLSIIFTTFNSTKHFLPGLAVRRLWRATHNAPARQRYCRNHTIKKHPHRVLFSLCFFYNIFDASCFLDIHRNVWWYDIVVIERHCHTGPSLRHRAEGIGISKHLR